ncbi:amidohydrolase family protein [Zhouia amylolytica]|uniref:amidohydrolase family protein n=1 Tax=Zhouia amylolytica TaxID=376730 RepID=UPI0020CED28B|nr:amidohydrolase family protein [Zhouia amylolytica]MCQ0110951.1 amidohydrolase family protein [Zhouia amylolytica]
MRYFTLILLLATVLSCKQSDKVQFISLNSQARLTYKQSEPSPDVLKYIKYQNNSIALTNATFYDGKGNPPKENQTLIVENGHFVSIGKTSKIAIPEEAVVIDLKGKTVIPGIVGVHNHLHIPRFPFIGELASKLYLASGVTTIQTCGSAAPQQEIELAKRIEEGKYIGPDIVTSGPYFTGKGGNPNMIIPESESQIRDTIQYWAQKGVRWFKVYRNTTPEDLEIIINEAHKQNAKVTGHLCSITFEEAVHLGIDGIEHGLNSTSDFRNNKTHGVCNGSREYMDELKIESDEVKSLQELMIKNDVFLTSTLAIYEASIPERAFADQRTLAMMSPYLVSQYQERRRNYDLRKSIDSIRVKRLKRIMEFEHQFYKLGGTLTAGVDAGRHVLPGFGDQRNFELLKEAGFNNQEALKIMTGNGAKVLSNSAIGTIDIGKKANFVILKGPIENSIRHVELVFKNGFGYDPLSILTELKGKFIEEQ